MIARMEASFREVMRRPVNVEPVTRTLPSAPFKGNPEPVGSGGASRPRHTENARRPRVVVRYSFSDVAAHGLLYRKFVSSCSQLWLPLKKDGVSPSTNAFLSTVRSRDQTLGARVAKFWTDYSFCCLIVYKNKQSELVSKEDESEQK
ncbi:hypothetical protein MRX96_002261 [Rhipicephalus microplus]